MIIRRGLTLTLLASDRAKELFTHRYVRLQGRSCIGCSICYWRRRGSIYRSAIRRTPAQRQFIDEEACDVCGAREGADEA